MPCEANCQSFTLLNNLLIRNTCLNSPSSGVGEKGAFTRQGSYNEVFLNSLTFLGHSIDFDFRYGNVLDLQGNTERRMDRCAG